MNRENENFWLLSMMRWRWKFKVCKNFSYLFLSLLGWFERNIFELKNILFENVVLLEFPYMIRDLFSGRYFLVISLVTFLRYRHMIESIWAICDKVNKNGLDVLWVEGRWKLRRKWGRSVSFLKHNFLI